MNKKTALAVLLVLVFIVVFSVVGNRYVQELSGAALPPGTSLAPGNSSDGGTAGLAPEFQLQTMDGAMVALENYRGKPVVLNFWASW